MKKWNDDTKECNVSSVSIPEQCAYVKSHCADERRIGNAILPYFTMKYCLFRKVPWLFTIFAIIIPHISMLILHSTAQFYFVNSLTFIADTLKIPDSITGLLLIAIGNEIPGYII